MDIKFDGFIKIHQAVKLNSMPNFPAMYENSSHYVAFSLL